MESDDDYQFVYLPEVPRPRFKRLKKAVATSKNQRGLVFDFDFAKLEALEEDEKRRGSVFEEKGGEAQEDSTELVSPHNSEVEIRLEPVYGDSRKKFFDDEGVLVSDQQWKEVKTSLEFGHQFRGEEHQQIGEDLVSKEIHEEIGETDKEIGDMNMEKFGIQQDVEGDGKKTKKKMRSKGGLGRQVKPKELASNRRIAAKVCCPDNII